MTKQNDENAPTDERRRQNGGLFAENVVSDDNSGVLIKRYRAVWTCPLDAYRSYGVLSRPEYRAGLRFRAAYYNAVLSRGATQARLSNYPASTRLNADEKLLKAAYHVLSPHNKGVIIDICGHDQPARDKAMFEKLRKGLGHLALQWNMAAIEACEKKEG